MRDEHTLTLRQANQARAEFAVLGEELDGVKNELALLPTRKELALPTLLATLTEAALVPAGTEALFR